MFTVTIKTSNAAFGEDDLQQKAAEVARILRGIANDLEFEGAWYLTGRLYDANGNNVGSYALDD